jgi:hypothetical protein
MRTTLRIILPLLVSVVAVPLLFAAYQVRIEKRNLRNDLSRRVEILGEGVLENAEPMLERSAERNLQRLIERFRRWEHLKGVAIYNTAGATLAITPGLSPAFRSRPTIASQVAQEGTGVGEFLSTKQAIARNPEEPVSMHIYALPLRSNREMAGTLVLFHDTRYIDRQVSRALRNSLLTALVRTLLITGLALILVRSTFTGLLTRTAKWLRTLCTGQPNQPPALLNGEFLDEINHEVMHLPRELNTARAGQMVDRKSVVVREDTMTPRMVELKDWSQSIVELEISGNPGAPRIGSMYFRLAAEKPTRLMGFAHVDLQVYGCLPGRTSTPHCHVL